MKTLVFGNGQLANFVPKYFGSPVVITSVDITSPKEVRSAIVANKPDVVINTAAKTSIDWCEQNKVAAFEVNTLGAYSVWEACRERGIFMVHFSSGCIYHSRIYDEIYKENDKPSPRCYYSWTKVWADNLLGKDPNLLILRPRVIISSRVSNRNTLAKWMVYSHFIKDQNSVTIIEDMMPILKKMVDKRISGVFNIVNKGTISPLEVAKMLKESVNENMDIQETTLDEVNKNLVAKRCSTVLDTTALEMVGFEMPPIKEAIRFTIEMFKMNLKEGGGLSALDAIRDETRKKYMIIQKKPTTYLGRN